jgi:hypothetical protein
MNYTYLFDAAWVLLSGWIVVLLAVGLVAFGKDLLRLRGGQETAPGKQH